MGDLYPDNLLLALVIRSHDVVYASLNAPGEVVLLAKPVNTETTRPRLSHHLVIWHSLDLESHLMLI